MRTRSANTGPLLGACRSPPVAPARGGGAQVSGAEGQADILRRCQPHRLERRQEVVHRNWPGWRRPKLISIWASAGVTAYSYY
ncbi:MAG: hypothetical protein KME26_16295 [Oscillatoria princeps RMCB-10]|nr:hypothetical protein [Oscillatoria princeps RMCB-10]